ncbi:MAG: leucine-rich repeat protein [Lachnospiraceae bacterium]|nr:leucine-rich repeat protein [Lachnospiraceae bacterium]
MVTKKTKILTLALATIVAAGGVAFAINNNKMSSASAANTNTSSETKGTTEDGFSYTIKDGVVTITGYNFNPNNDTFYGMKASNGHYYGFCKSSKTYKEAKELCKKSGGYLISIDSQEEKDSATELARAYGRFFIGSCSVGEKVLADDDYDNFNGFSSELSFLKSEEGLKQIKNKSDYPLFLTNESLLEDYSRLNEDERELYNFRLMDLPSWMQNFYCYTKYDISSPFVCEWEEGSTPKNFHEIKSDIVIPEKIEGKPVKYLDKNTFKTIGDYKLRNYIKNVDIKAKLYMIDEGTFENAENLKTVTLPSSLMYIMPSSFKHCRSLKSITIPDKTTCIGKHAFEGSGLTTVIFGKKTKTINDFAFASTEIKTLNIPSTVRTIGEGAFINSSLTSVTMEEGVETIKDGAFDCCRNLTSINFPKSVKFLSANAIRCTGIETLRVPANAELNPSMKIISFELPVWIDGSRYFREYGSSTIRNIIFEDGRTTIKTDSLKDMSVKFVFVPESVTTIENSAFSTNYDGFIYLPQSFSGKTTEELNAMLGENGSRNKIRFYTDESEWEGIMNTPFWLWDSL